MKSLSDVCVVIAAAGRGERAGLGYNKTLFGGASDPLIRRTVRQFEGAKKIVVAYSPGDKNAFSDALRGIEGVEFSPGGKTRGETVRRALELCDGEVVLVHDGARPNVSRRLIRRVAEDAAIYGSAVPCIKADVALKHKCGDRYGFVNRDEYFFVQTPQGFRLDQLKSAYASVGDNCSDDSEVWEKSGRTVHVVDGEAQNIKYTYPYQFASDDETRIGTGFDVHRLEKGRALILGGVELQFDKGLVGHSDADVLTHAVMDALLSAAGLPDIGVLFPDNDPSTEGISSMTLLNRTLSAIGGVEILSVSAVIIAMAPRLAPVIPRIRENLARHLNISLDRVNVSATTTEGLGIVGQGLGMAATATALIKKSVL